MESFFVEIENKNLECKEDILFYTVEELEIFLKVKTSKQVIKNIIVFSDGIVCGKKYIKNINDNNLKDNNLKLGKKYIKEIMI